MDEVSYALEEGKQIIPVLYKECGVPFRLRRVQRVDFSVSYDKGFADLLKALNVSRPAARPTSAAREISDCERPEAELAGPEVKQKAEQYARKQSGKLRERGKTAMIGAVAGAVFGTIAVFLWGRTYEQELWWLGALLAGVPTAITGALTGTNWKVILAAAVAAVVGTVIVVLVGGSNELLGALLYGTPLSALLGALSAVAWFRIVARHNTTLNRSGG